MRLRVMPKKMQIYLLKRNFLIWNKWQECRDFDVSAEIDEIDWDAIVKEGFTYRENLDFLSNNYPQYTWDYSRIPEAFNKRLQKQREQEEEFERPFRIAAATGEHEAMHAMEQQDSSVEEEPPMPEVISEDCNAEQTEHFEIYSKEIEVMPHKTHSKGKSYEYGRIQLVVDKNLVGCRVKINVLIPKL